MRTVSSGGYSRHQYTAAALRSVAKTVAAAIPELLERFNADAVVVTGKSGHSVAFAALMLVDFPLCVVRKESDQSHGRSVEGPDGLQVRRYIILDDFVASGTTVRKCVKTMHANNQYEVECAAIIEYSPNGYGASHVKLYDEARDSFQDVPIINLVKG